MSTLTPPAVRAQAPDWLPRYGVYAAVLVLLVFNALFTDNFLDLANLRTQLVQVAPVVIVALGMAWSSAPRGSTSRSAR